MDKRATAVIAALTLYACDGRTFGQQPWIRNALPDRPSLPDHVVEPPAPRLRVATFNLQVFGPSKAGRPELVDEVASIIEQYDLVAVQEIKDASSDAAYVLLDALHARGAPHQMVLSERSGMQDDDAWSREQYAYYYDPNVLDVVGGAAIYDDATWDRFSREPFVARFASIRGRLDLIFIDVHTRPAAAVAEIDALSDVVAWGRERFPDARGTVLLGDFNADCSYATPAQLDPLDLRDPEYTWVVPDDADTNVASSRCAYDRVVLHGTAALAYDGVWGVDDAGFRDPDVSDHWPVWFELNDTAR